MGRWIKPDSSPHGSEIHLPPHLKYSKHPRCNTAKSESMVCDMISFAHNDTILFVGILPCAEKSRYKAIANTLIAVQYRFRAQWNAPIC